MDARSLAPKGVKLIPDDLWQRACFTLSARIVRTQFHGQTKEKLTTRHAARLLELCTRDAFELWLNEHADEGKKIVELAVEQAMARLAKGKKVERKKSSGIATLPGKLVDCASGDITRNELFLVEGDSAGGSAKQGRDRRFQAILPLRGKLLNVEKARLDKIVGSENVRPLIIALGAGIEGIGDSFDIAKLRYHRIIIMTDADVDGAHIRTLLLTFFYRFMPQVIENGFLYIAQPPLYRISTGKVTRYAQSEKERDRIVKEMDRKNVSVQRFKGLGEMNADQLWETTMNPATRTLLRAEIEDAVDADAIFTMLMGEKVAPRKDFIKTEARKVQNLDV